MKDLNIDISGLPERWTWATLDDLGEYVNGYAFSQTDTSPQGTPIVRIQNLTDETRPFNYTSLKLDNRHAIDDGDILVSWSATLDVFEWNRGPAYLNQHIFKATAYEDVVDKRFFHHTLKEAVRQLSKSEHVHGSTMLHINRGPFLAHRVALPPLAAQKRIAGRLDAEFAVIDKGIQEALTAQSKITQLTKCQRESLGKGSLTSDWRDGADELCDARTSLEAHLERRQATWKQTQEARFRHTGRKPPKDWMTKYEPPVAPLEEVLDPLPTGWTWASLDQLAVSDEAIVDGPFGSNLKTEHYVDHGPGVIRLQNIGEGVFIDPVAHISDEHYDMLTRHAVLQDDVVVALLGDNVPRACMVPTELGPAIVKADCARVRVDQSVAEPGFVMHQLNSMSMRAIAGARMRGIGRARIALSTLRALPIALCSLAEQRESLLRLERAQESNSKQFGIIQLAVSKAEQHRKRLLHDAFAGALVEPLASDSDAAELLLRSATRKSARLSTPPQKATKAMKPKVVKLTLIQALQQSPDWQTSEQLFEACGIRDGSSTEEVEAVYEQLRALVASKRVELRSRNDEAGRKRGDEIRLKKLEGQHAP